MLRCAYTIIAIAIIIVIIDTVVVIVIIKVLYPLLLVLLLSLLIASIVTSDLISDFFLLVFIDVISFPISSSSPLSSHSYLLLIPSSPPSPPLFYASTFTSLSLTTLPIPLHIHYKAPYVSTMRYGISGLPLGLAKGFAGLGVKPVVGALDAITHAGDSVRAIVKHFTQEAAVPVYRQRFSSSFGKYFFLLY